MNQKGFTMIELLVVMAILAAMMTMGIATYSKSLQRGRDAKRISDMQEIQKGFELYYAKNDTYASCDVMGDEVSVFASGLPNPPAGGLVYDSACDSDSYCYCAQVEIPEDYGNSTVNDCTGFAGKSTATLYYCVQNVQ